MMEHDRSADEALIELLAPRITADRARRRLKVERNAELCLNGNGTWLDRLEQRMPIDKVIRRIFRLLMLDKKASRNALDIAVIENTLTIRGLPLGLDGIRILHLSDLHLDMNEYFPMALVSAIADIDYDICVMTGDYRYRTSGTIDHALQAMYVVRKHLKGTVYGVLGNHDSIRMIPSLEEMGIRMLINESVSVQIDGSVLKLAGVDDPHFYRAHDFVTTCSALTPQDTTILLAHSPEVYQEAADYGFSVMLCGHTHGGQICLPAGIPIVTDADSPRRMARGNWTYGNMLGYTSTGAGSSIVDMRINCRPEVAVHVLRSRT